MHPKIPQSLNTPLDPLSRREVSNTYGIDPELDSTGSLNPTNPSSGRSAPLSRGAGGVLVSNKAETPDPGNLNTPLDPLSRGEVPKSDDYGNKLDSSSSLNPNTPDLPRTTPLSKEPVPLRREAGGVSVSNKEKTPDPGNLNTPLDPLSRGEVSNTDGIDPELDSTGSLNPITPSSGRSAPLSGEPVLLRREAGGVFVLSKVENSDPENLNTPQ